MGHITSYSWDYVVYSYYAYNPYSTGVVRPTYYLNGQIVTIK